MAIQVPQTVRQAWGDELVLEFVPWLEQVIEEKTSPRLEQLVEEKAVPRDEYRQVLSRLDVLEHDVADIKENVRELRREMRGEIGDLRAEMRGEIGDLRGEIGDLRAEMRGEIGDLRAEMNERFDRVNERFDQMDHHFEVRLGQMSERMLVQTRWLIGSIALFGTILTILQAIAQFTP
jgi:tetrahydromethanopterin S-methyltransferase subunit G